MKFYWRTVEDKRAGRKCIYPREKRFKLQYWCIYIIGSDDLIKYICSERWWAIGGVSIICFALNFCFSYENSMMFSKNMLIFALISNKRFYVFLGTPVHDSTECIENKNIPDIQWSITYPWIKRTFATSGLF